MAINAALLGQFVLIFALVMAAICFYLGRRKTPRPVFSAVVGFFLALVPPLVLVYLVVLLLKKDLGSPSAMACD